MTQLVRIKVEAQVAIALTEISGYYVQLLFSQFKNSFGIINGHKVRMLPITINTVVICGQEDCTRGDSKLKIGGTFQGLG